MKKIVPILAVMLFLAACEYQSIEELRPKETVDSCPSDSLTFQTDIEPIFRQNCNNSGCHNNGSFFGDFTTYAGIKAKIDDNDKIRQRVIIEQNMPASGPISECEMKKLTAWLDAGAPNN
jgi:hypothetical protein